MFLLHLKKHLTPIFCERHFIENTNRTKNGKFIARLLFITSSNVLQPNRNKVLAIFCRFIARLNPDIRQQYTEFLAEYESLDHMFKVYRDDTGYFIPHHVVLRPSSTTT